VRDPCELCADDAKLQASHPNAAGQLNKLCATHAKEQGTYSVRKPCELCADDAKLSASYPNAAGQPNKLCAAHAREQGTYSVLNPCELCADDAKLQANYPNAAGQLNKLCSTHAKREGSYVIRNRCTFTTLDGAQCENGGVGSVHPRCVRHQPGYIAAVTGYSKAACAFLDALAAKENGARIQHVHYDGLTGKTVGSEYKVLEWGRRGTKVDGYYETASERVVVEFHGDFWHGNPALYDADDWNPKTNCTFGELWEKTAERMDELKFLGYRVLYIWESDFREWQKHGVFQALPVMQW
jgi:hypothetical protein